MNLQEHIKRILKEETSLKETIRNMVKTQGFKMAAKIVGSLEELHEILDLKGTQDDMIFIANAVLEHDIEYNICKFFIVKTQHSIKIYIEVPKLDPTKDINEWSNKHNRIALESKISDYIFWLGKFRVKGHTINVLPGEC